MSLPGGDGSALATDAEHGRSAIDRVRGNEAALAFGTGFPAAAIDLQPLRESSRLAARVAIISEGGAARRDRLAEHLDDAIAQCLGLAVAQRRRCPRWVDASAPERLVCVDVA